jgi:hypothetical protein
MPVEALAQSAPADVSQSGGGTSPATDTRRDEPAAQTLFGSKAHHGGYGALETKATAVLSQPAMLVGLQGGWIIDHRFVLGAAGYGLATRHDAPDAFRVEGQPSTMEMGYGGLRLGYLLQPASLIHVGFGLLIGGGGLVAVSRNRFTTTDPDGDVGMEHRTAHAEGVFALEPQVEGELNVTSFMRIAASGSYRYIAAVGGPGLSNANLSAPAVGLALRFGAF